ncbi:MAG: MBL fold metallo-hydrolase [Planctomycetia bacterium]|nr:MBL fold metallo-hydrolase [Planctomycetia bacterium]
MKSGIAVLGSGSLGNAVLVQSTRTRVLIDMGFSGAELSRRLATVGLETSDIDAIFVTHTHSDHVGTSAVSLSRREGIAMFSHSDNFKAMRQRLRGFDSLKKQGLATAMPRSRSLKLGDMAVECFLLPHDADGVNLGYRFTVPGRDGTVRITVATDLGHFPARAARWFASSKVIVLESNHDPEMLASSARPQDLKDRISGPDGHLSNEDCTEAILRILGSAKDATVHHVVLAHLSRECNTSILAINCARQALHDVHPDGIKVHVADQYRVSPVIPV